MLVWHGRGAGIALRRAHVSACPSDNKDKETGNGWTSSTSQVCNLSVFILKEVASSGHVADCNKLIHL